MHDKTVFPQWLQQFLIVLFYNWAKESIQLVTFEYVDKADIANEEHLLEQRLETAVTIEGTQSYRAYYPLEDSRSKLMVKPFSNSQAHEIVKISNYREPISMDGINGYEYGDAWWLALILESCPDRIELKLQFLHPAGPSPSFSFPTRDDILTVKHTDILMKANPTISKSGRVYCVSTAEAASLLELGLRCTYLM